MHRLVKILLTGASGQVGFELKRALALHGELICPDRQQFDLSQPSTLAAALDGWQPDIIVNPAAYTAVDKAEDEPDLAHAINAEAPAVLAQWAARHDALLLHYSTDYVFDGNKNGAYVEGDAPNPLSVYGRSKLAGEDAIRASGCRHLILRTSWIFGAYGGNFLKTMLRLMRVKSELRVVADQIGAPTSAALLADVSAQMIARYLIAGQPGNFPFGTYHAVASGEISWHGYALEIDQVRRSLGDISGVAHEAILAIPASAYPLPASRPMNSCLDCSKLQHTFDLRLPAWQVGVTQVMTLLNSPI